VSGTDDAVARPELCVGAILVESERLLLVRRGRPPAAGLWSVPGGRVEPGETMAAAVVREVLEETALEVVCGPLVGWVERIGPGHHFVIFDFEVTLLGADTPRAGDDAAEVAWVPLDEVENLPLVDGLAEFLAEHDVIELIA